MTTPVDAKLKDYQVRIKEKDDQVAELKEEQRRIDEEISRAMQLVKDKDKERDQMNVSIKTIDARLGNMRQALDEYKSEVERLQKDTKKTKAEIDKEIDKLKIDFNKRASKNNFKDTLVGIPDAENEIAATQKEKVKLESELKNIEGMRAKTNSDLSKLQQERTKKLNEIQVIENDKKILHTDKTELERGQTMMKAVDINAGSVPIQTTRNTYIVAGGNDVLSPAKKTFYGFGVFFATYVANTIMHAPAAMVGFHNTSSGKAKAIFFSVFFVIYIFLTVLVAVLYHRTTQDGYLDAGASEFYKKMLMFLGISVVFGLCMYWIVNNLSKDVRNEAKEKTGIDPDYNWVDLKIAFFIGCYVVILQLLCLVLMFGLFSSKKGGMGEWLKNSALKLSKTALGSRAKNVEFKMDHLDTHIKQYEDCFRVTEMLRETAKLRERGHGNFSDLVEQLSDIAKANKLPNAPPGRVSEFYAGMMNILFGIEISSQGVVKVDDARIDARVLKIQQQVRLQESAVTSLRSEVQSICGQDNVINMNRLADTIKKFQSMYEAIGIAEKEAIDLMGTLTPAYARYSDLLLIVKQIETIRETANNEMKNVFASIERCGNPDVYRSAGVGLAPMTQIVGSDSIAIDTSTDKLNDFYAQLGTITNEDDYFLLYGNVVHYMNDVKSVRVQFSQGKVLLDKIVDAMHAINPKSFVFEQKLKLWEPFHKFMKE